MSALSKLALFTTWGKGQPCYVHIWSSMSYKVCYQSTLPTKVLQLHLGGGGGGTFFCVYKIAYNYTSSCCWALNPMSSTVLVTMLAQGTATSYQTVKHSLPTPNDLQVPNICPPPHLLWSLSSECPLASLGPCLSDHWYIVSAAQKNWKEVYNSTTHLGDHGEESMDIPSCQ